jgi:2-phosphosulfolactate phosphatase
MYFDQKEYDITFEWGLRGLEAVSPHSDVVIVVDVLSFTTCVDIVVANGGIVFPYRWKDDSVSEYASSVQAIAASSKRRFADGFSLSPTSLEAVTPGTRLVLPSPNGSTLSLATGTLPTFAGCLRNAYSVAQAARAAGERIAVIAAGEKWDDGSLRPSFEDLVGAGAIIDALLGKRSPEAETAVASFHSCSNKLAEKLLACSSGRELVERGFKEDVLIASQINASETASVLFDGYFHAV